jgi:hypothetical protein
LQNLYFVDDDGLPIILNWTLLTQVGYILEFLPILDLYAWLNIFENSTEDRDDTSTQTFLPQTAFSTKYYINSDGTAQSLYDILNNFLIDFRCCLRQTNGVWQIMRWGDIRIFSDSTMPGTLYNNSGESEIFFPETISILSATPFPLPGQRYPINENQLSRILRPYQFAKETFNYQQPPLIPQANLQIQAGAVPFSTTTIGDFRYDDYTLATYIPLWIQRNGDNSYLEVKTDISVTPENEVERYIVTPADTTNHKGVQFPPIPVSKNDTFDFSLQFRTDTDSGDDLFFRCRFLIVYPGGTVQALDGNTFPGTLFWTISFPVADWDTGGTIYVEVPNGDDSSQYTLWSLSSFLDADHKLPPFPGDGILLIQVDGCNASTGSQQTTFWNEIVLNVNTFINTNTIITAQFHNNSQDEAIRQNLQYDVTMDDSPKNTITGTLFTNALTDFQADIGNVYFTKTSAWHRQGVTESRRLGDLNTFNDLFIQRKTRTIVEGDFHGLHDVNLMSLINLPDKFPGKKFIFGTARFDYYECIWTATLYELFEDGEVDGDLDNTYLFNYIYDNG